MRLGDPDEAKLSAERLLGVASTLAQDECLAHTTARHDAPTSQRIEAAALYGG